MNGAYGGLRFRAGVIAPYRLVTGTFKSLLQKYPSRLSIDCNTPITSITHTSDKAYPYVLSTPRGTVKAANVIHCTNGHTGHLVPGLRGKMYPRRGTMSVQSPGSSFPDNSAKQSWSFYFRPEHDAQVGDVETGRYYGFQSKETGHLWIGGDRDSIDGFISADDSQIDAHAEKNLRQILPKLFSKDWVKSSGDVQGIWTGIMCYTGDQLPFIGRLPASATQRQGSGEWIAAGWNTYGMTNGLLCGDALGKIIVGQDVSEWFPEAYMITEERLKGKKFETEAVLKDYFKRIGATQYLDSKESRL
jgi:glycine/D-amino acid oxidase-like deaminating enzyme